MLKAKIPNNYSFFAKSARDFSEGHTIERTKSVHYFRDEIKQIRQKLKYLLETNKEELLEPEITFIKTFLEKTSEQATEVNQDDFLLLIGLMFDSIIERLREVKKDMQDKDHNIDDVEENNLFFIVDTLLTYIKTIQKDFKRDGIEGLKTNTIKIDKLTKALKELVLSIEHKERSFDHIKKIVLNSEDLKIRPRRDIHV